MSVFKLCQHMDSAMDCLEKNQADLIEIRRLVKEGQRIVFVSGNFNIVHPGHLRLLQFASESGDFLVVGVSGAGTQGATLPEHMRLDGVKAISFVSYAFVLHEPPEAFI